MEESPEPPTLLLMSSLPLMTPRWGSWAPDPGAVPTWVTPCACFHGGRLEESRSPMAGDGGEPEPHS